MLVLTVQAILRRLKMWDEWRNTGLTFFVYYGLNLNLYILPNQETYRLQKNYRNEKVFFEHAVHPDGDHAVCRSRFVQ